MSILGNDFLPSSLGLKIRDDGHAELIEILKRQMHNKVSILKENTIQQRGLIEFFKSLTESESRSIYHYVNKKCMIARNLGFETLKKEDGFDIKVGDNNYPLAHIEEEILINKQHKKLVDNWEVIYSKWFNGFSDIRVTKDKTCNDYLYGIQWIWNYYTGKESVCFNWYYPYSLPPLWEWLYTYLKTHSLPVLDKINIIGASDILPIEQLSLVLPIQSWGLIKNDKYKNIPFYMPQYFPKSFSFETIGKRFFWECEANIPIPGILEIKKCIE
jgi:5'-3' exonuclease